MQTGPGFVPTFLYYFVSSTLLVVFVISNGLGDAAQSEIFNNPFQVGILFGLITGGLGAYFNSYQSFKVPLKGQSSSSETLEETLTEMRYEKVQDIDQAKVYERPFPSSLFAGKLIVQMHEEAVVISGRSSRIRQLKQLIGEP